VQSDTYHEADLLMLSPEVSTFSGSIERDWWLSSFTALSRNIRDNGISRPDRDLFAEPTIATIDEESALSLLRFELTKGAHSGNLLHDILEHLDFEQPDWDTALHWPLLKYGDLPTGYLHSDLVLWLEEVIHCPLAGEEHSSALGGEILTLASLSQKQTLREAEFYFPLTAANTKQLAILLTDHRNSLPSNANTGNEKLAPSLNRSSRVELPALSKLNGMMHGFIDLIFEHQGKYYICDYKSNYLGDNYQNYQAPMLKESIEQHHYDLQYLIYSLALHRYLATSLPDYQVEKHFGGIYYLFLRGMTNDTQNQGCGSYFRAITPDEIHQLDRIFLGKSINSSEKGGVS